MSTPHQVHPLEMLTAALGGRRLYMYLWVLWLFGAIVGHYAQDMTRGESIQRSSAITFTVCVAASVLYAFLLLRGLISKERREGLLSLQAGLPPANPALRVIVWLVPILALGAALAPALLK